MTKITKNLIPISIIIAGLLIAGALFYVNKGGEKSFKVIPAQQAAEKAINYINKNLSGQGRKASLEKVAEKNGLYKIHLKIGEQEYDSYVTKDGKFLFPVLPGSPIDLNPAPPKEIPKSEKPEVSLFVMAFCPYGNQAEGIMEPVQELLKDKANISLHYIVSKDAQGKYHSLHGAKELHEDVRELCVNKYQKDKFWDFVKAINDKATAQNVDEKWEEIAKSLGIDVQKIKDCQSREAETLLTQEAELDKAEYPVQNPIRHQNQEKITISGSPTLVINGMIYDGERSSEGYKTGICSAFKNPPKECSQKLENKSKPPEGGCK